MSKINFKSPKTTLIIAVFLLLLGFIILPLMTRYSWVDFTKTGQIGDTFGGIINPFVAIVGVFLTYMAFYMQYEANIQQREQFKRQLNEDRAQFEYQLKENQSSLEQQLASDKRHFQEELLIQKKQFNKSRIETQFYEMLKLHKENVNEISISVLPVDLDHNKKLDIIDVSGRRAFDHLVEELRIIYYVTKKHFSENSSEKNLRIAYEFFFFGVNGANNNKSDLLKDDLLEIRRKHKSKYPQYFLNELRLALNDKEYNMEFYCPLNLFNSYSSQFAHYYRHLFQTVKFVASQDKNLLSYEEKRKYLRILRAQLSNNEQAMLFYNWKGGFGYAWENEKNNFFTDYRMIHNLYNDLLIPDFDLTKIFADPEAKIKKEKNRTFDPLFEFEDRV